jgi:hypothetical protein
MSDLLEELRSKWNQALGSGAGGRQWRGVALSPISPVRLLAGIRDRDNRISVLVETALRHAPKHRVRLHAEGISLLDQRANDEGILRLALTLERADLRDIFEVLALDLVSVATASTLAGQAISQIVRRVEAWQACLRSRQRGLSREEQAGLIGELVVVSIAAEEIAMADVLDAWSGPMNGLHDFQGAGIAIEVKTTIGVSQQIHISRLDQLNPRGLDTLLLARIRLHEAPSGKTLPEFIGALRTGLAENFPYAVAFFEEKLMRAGFLDADADLYSSLRTIVNEIRAFRVSEGFPRLTGKTSRLPS